MARTVFTPLQLGDVKLERLQLALATSLSALESKLEAIASPNVAVAVRDHVVTAEAFVDYRGAGGHTVTLPLASSNGQGRGRVVHVQNNGPGDLIVAAQGRETINGEQSITLEAGESVIAAANGATKWSASGVGGGPHVIADDGTLLPQRPTLNFTGDLTATDNAIDGTTDVTVTASGVDVLDPWAAFKPRNIYIPAGVGRDGGPGDDGTMAESEATSTTASFGTWIFAYPEVAPFDATIDRLGFYFEGGGTPKAWAGIARETTDANGNSYPGSIAAIFHYQHSSGFDGQKFRTGAVNVAVTKGERFWVLFQGNAAASCNGYRRSVCFRNVFGNNTPATFSTSNQRGLIGWITATAVTYNAALTSFPAGANMLGQGSLPITASGSNTPNRPSVYFRYAP